MADGKARVKPCKGCGSTTRPVPHPGPRCATCQRAWRKRNARLGRLRRVAAIYNLTPEQYAALEDASPKNAKGEALCWTCVRWRARAVDHDHACCPGKTSCGRCVRGLLCGTCNTMLGRQGDRVETFIRTVEYLTNPPAKAVLNLEVSGDDPSPADEGEGHGLRRVQRDLQGAGAVAPAESHAVGSDPPGW